MNNLNMAKIQLNGSPFEVEAGLNLNHLLDKLEISKNKVAVEINGVIAEKNNYSKIKISQNDKLEIVHFIGGG